MLHIVGGMADRLINHEWSGSIEAVPTVRHLSSPRGFLQAMANLETLSRVLTILCRTIQARANWSIGL
jgi:hypothetical protein